MTQQTSSPEKNFAPVVILIVGLVILLLNSVFIVNQKQQALVLQFGEAKRVIQSPGLNVKVPFIQNVQYYEARLLDLDPDVQQVILADQKRLDVDTYSRYRISDPLKFFQTLRTQAEAQRQLSNIVNSSMRDILGNVTLAQVLSKERAQIMQNITDIVNKAAASRGVMMTDVRIGRADLPDETSEAIYRRMISERNREAREFRAQGQEQFQEITSKADKERTVILSEAEKKAQILRGEGDAISYKTYTDAFGKDKNFFAFYRSLQAYREALNADDTILILTPENEFFRYFEGSR